MLLQPAKKTIAFAKIGIFGFQGSGKTFTASRIAMGICEFIKLKKVAMFDTEGGTDFMLDQFTAAGIEAFQVKSRSFNDLVQTIKECNDTGVPVLIIDSITHVWRDLCESYDKKLKRNGRLQFQDWNIIKTEWRKYTDAFLTSKCHIIVCGRAGDTYDYSFNEDGSKDLIKTGTKMKAEGEFGFEPSLVIEMERTTQTRDQIEKLIGKSDPESRAAKQGMKATIGSKWIHRAHILKDRTDTMDGMVFDDPTFADFSGHFAKLNIGGEHAVVDTTRNSEESFAIHGKPDWAKEKERCVVIVEEITGALEARFPGTGKEEKIAKSAIKKYAFGTYSDTAIDAMKLGELEMGAARVQEVLNCADVKAKVAEIVSAETAKMQVNTDPARTAALKVLESEYAVYCAEHKAAKDKKLKVGALSKLPDPSKMDTKSIEDLIVSVSDMRGAITKMTTAEAF